MGQGINFKLEVDSGSASRKLKSFGKDIKGTSRATTNWAKAGFLAAGGAAAFNAGISALKRGVSGLLKPLKDSIFEIGTLGDRLAKDSRMVGVTAEQFQVMEFAAERSGTGISAVTNGLKRLSRAMVDSQSGSTQLVKTFEALDINLKKSDGTLRDVFDVFLDLADRFEAMGESAERGGTMMQLLGRSGTVMANMMSQGSAGILELRRELEELGAIMGTETLNAGEEFVDRMADLKFAFRGLKIELGTTLLPDFTAFVAQLTSWIATADFSRLRELAEDFFGLSRSVAMGADAVLQLGMFSPRGAAAMEAQAAAAHGLTRRIEAGAATWEDFTKQVPGEEKWGTWTSDMGLLGEAVETLIPPLEHLGGHEAAAAAALEEVGAVLPGVTAQMQVSGDQIADMQQRWSLLGGSVDSVVDSMVAEGQATELQGHILRAYGAAQEEVAQYTAKSSSEEERLSAARSRHSELMDDMGHQYRLAIASIRSEEEARKADADAVREQLAAERELARQRERHLRRNERGLAAQEAARRALHEAFMTDTDAVVAAFRRGQMDEHQFRATMSQANLDLLEHEWEERNRIIEEGLETRAINTDEADAYMLESQAIYEQARRDLSNETEAHIQERQIETVETFVRVLQAGEQLARSLSNLSRLLYEEGNEDAKKSAVALFHVAQAFALAVSIVNTALAVTSALSDTTVPNYYVRLGNAIAAGVIGAAEIATIIGTSIRGVGDAGITPELMQRAAGSGHTALMVRNDEMVLDPVGTRHITEMLELQKTNMGAPGEAEQHITTTVELDGRVLGEAVDSYLIRQDERGLSYTSRIRQEYVQ